jgi:hypothetical protein
VGAVIAAGAAIAMAPWIVYASQRAGRVVAVTEGSAAALFVGTYLPGGGTTVGMKRDLGGEAKRLHPELRELRDFHLPAEAVLDVAAARHPDLPRDEAISKEGRRNLERYALGDPIGFAGMMLDKVGRMWGRYARGGARPTETPITAWHVLLVIGSALGLAAGIWRARTRLPVLGAIALTLLYSTALHAVLVSQARYNLPLMPALIAGGVAGWVLLGRARTRSFAAPAGAAVAPAEPALAGTAAAPAPAGPCPAGAAEPLQSPAETAAAAGRRPEPWA